MLLRTEYPFPRPHLAPAQRAARLASATSLLDSNFTVRTLLLGEIIPVACKERDLQPADANMGVGTLALDFELKLSKLRCSLGALKQHGPRGSMYLR